MIVILDRGFDRRKKWCNIITSLHCVVNDSFFHLYRIQVFDSYVVYGCIEPKRQVGGVRNLEQKKLLADILSATNLVTTIVCNCSVTFWKIRFGLQANPLIYLSKTKICFDRNSVIHNLYFQLDQSNKLQINGSQSNCFLFFMNRIQAITETYVF